MDFLLSVMEAIGSFRVGKFTQSDFSFKSSLAAVCRDGKQNRKQGIRWGVVEGVQVRRNEAFSRVMAATDMKRIVIREILNV